MILEGQQQHDCEPTLTDAEVVDFCRSPAPSPPPSLFSPPPQGPSPDAAEGSGGRDGYIKFDAVVPDAISERCCAFLDDHPSGEPSELFQEECASHSAAGSFFTFYRGCAGGLWTPSCCARRWWARSARFWAPALGCPSSSPTTAASAPRPRRPGTMCEPHPPCAMFPAPSAHSSAHCVGRVCGSGRRFALRPPGRNSAGDVLPAGHARRERTDVRPAALLPAFSILDSQKAADDQSLSSELSPLEWTLKPLHRWPREVVPGSHFMPISEHVPIEESAGRTMSSPAGTIFLTHYSILHRRAEATAEPTTRNMLK